ncbi:DUF2637 domain-containing protein [Schaalia suimastitidis]|uniref:DUF2637 domain-containing protein n=1 Tax=Schaalia suimastitidis TaxID=121163 RepID=UPI000405F91B|nr:DUF2637 domain-containing protein [Schaalia suimastitidis]
MDSQTVEMPRSVRVGAAIVSIIGTLGIAAASFVLSFFALTDLVVERSPINAQYAWMWAVALDGLIVVSTIALVAMVGSSLRERAWALTLLLTGVLLSTAGNVAHSVLGGHGFIGSLIAAVPPLLLAAITHLTVQLLRHALVSPERSAVTVSVDLVQEESAQAVVATGAMSGEGLVSVERAAVVERTRAASVEREQELVSGEVRASDERTPGDEQRSVVSSRKPQTVSAPTGDFEKVLAWVSAQREMGQSVTGNEIATHFNVSPATGRRWKTKALKQIEEAAISLDAAEEMDTVAA